MKFFAISIFLFVSTFHTYAQTTYDFCNCQEVLVKSGQYTLRCNGIVMEEGTYEDGIRSGEWITRNVEGEVIIKANYKADKLDGDYFQYHYKRALKLEAHFEEGKPVGYWKYYNDRGRVIKEGRYEGGTPTGIWKIYDKKGKEVIVEYDFDKATYLSSKTSCRLFQHNGIARDDESGEWMVLYWPERHIEARTKPLGGFLYAGDMFLDYLNVPYMFMNSYVHFEYTAQLEAYDNAVQNIKLYDVTEFKKFDPELPSFPFIVKTNSASKLAWEEHSKASIEVLKNRIRDVIAISGPWITDPYDPTVDLQLPFVLNKLAPHKP